MNDEIREFFKSLREILESEMLECLATKDKYKNTETMLRDYGEGLMYRVMELFDGYGRNKARYELKNIRSGKILNKDKCNLHGKFADEFGF